MQSAGFGIGYKIIQSRLGASNFLCFSRVIGWELTIKIMKDFVASQSSFLCVHDFGFWANVRYMFVVWWCSFSGCYCWLLSVEVTCHSIFLTSVVMMLSYLPPLSPKQMICLVYLMFGKELILFFLPDAGIPHCVAFYSTIPPGGKGFPYLKFQTTLPNATMICT